jgi:putative ABC transport system substrate-binding protein
MSQAKRRQLLVAAGALLAAPLARPQAPREVRRTGYLGLESPPDPKVPREKYPSNIALRKLGWIEGQNLIVERRYAEYREDRLDGLAQELVRLRLDLIRTAGHQATLAVARATKTIPIVFTGVPFPVEIGLAESFARPGRNLTGVSSFTGLEVSAKRIEFLREIAPAAKRLFNLRESQVLETLAGGKIAGGSPLDETFRRFGFEHRAFTIQSLDDVDKALVDARIWRAEVLNFVGGGYLLSAWERIAAFALQHRLPSVTAAHRLVDAGALLAYGPSREEYAAMADRAMEYVDKILRGAKPGELPVQRPSKYALTINLKTAKAIGVTIPQSLLVRADRLIK